MEADEGMMEEDGGNSLLRAATANQLCRHARAHTHTGTHTHARTHSFNSYYVT